MGSGFVVALDGEREHHMRATAALVDLSACNSPLAHGLFQQLGNAFRGADVKARHVRNGGVALAVVQDLDGGRDWASSQACTYVRTFHSHSRRSTTVTAVRMFGLG